MSKYDAQVALVVRLACLTESRDDEEQKALLAVARPVGLERLVETTLEELLG